MGRAESIDIDNPDELALAEFWLKRIKTKLGHRDK
jgi:hypothetical protein